jgi:hypothetical protein
MTITTNVRSTISVRLLAGLLASAAALIPSFALAQSAPPRDETERDDSDERDDSSTNIAVDFDFGAALDEPGTSAGGGGALRIGQEFDLFLISLTPEIGGSYHSFGGDDETRLYAGFLGGRLAVGKIIEPSIFAHVGVGHVQGFEERTAPLVNGGLALDFTLLPLIDLGVHGGYNVMFPRNDGSALEFVTLGAHAALVL